MTINPYDACPCGSGKKFKWCCQEIGTYVDKAMEQMQGGQHDASLRTADEMISKFPTNPQCYGHKAQLQMALGQLEEADKTLDAAFQINPNYAFGLLLRGMMRRQEGELRGALLLFRKAVDAYDPQAAGPLTQLFDTIGNIELIFNRPLAARYAFARTVELMPMEAELRQQFTMLFDDSSRLPNCARKAYEYRALKSGAASPNHAQLGEQVKALEALLASNETDPAAHFNLALAYAYQGENAKAIVELEKSVNLETDDAKGVETVALSEVLRCGLGMEEQADYVQHRGAYQILDGRSVGNLLQEWVQTGRMLAPQQNPQDGSITALVVEEGALAVNLGPKMSKLGAYLLIVANLLRLWHSNKESAEKIAKEMVAKTAMGLKEIRWDVSPIPFSEVVIEAYRFPNGPVDADTEAKGRREMESYFEEQWTQRSLKSLNGLTPETVAKNPASAKKVLGLIQFLDDCMQTLVPERDPEDTSPPPEPMYDFQRLRVRLGLSQDAPKSASAAVATASTTATNDAALEEAFRAAMKNRESAEASRLAEQIVASPINPNSPDRFPYFNALIQTAQQAGEHDRVLHWLDEAARSDREHNEGKRQGEYLLRRGQHFTKRGLLDEAMKAFDELAADESADVQHLGSALESLVSAKQGGHATKIGEIALAKARKKGNRDAEGHFLELLAAAKKLGG